MASAAKLWWLGLPLMMFGAVSLWLERRHRLNDSLKVFACCCPVFVAALLIVAAERINPHQTSLQVTDFIEGDAPYAPDRSL